MQRQSPSGEEEEQEEEEQEEEDTGRTITEGATLAVIDDVPCSVLTVVDMLGVVDMLVATMADEDTQ